MPYFDTFSSWFIVSGHYTKEILTPPCGCDTCDGGSLDCGCVLCCMYTAAVVYMAFLLSVVFSFPPSTIGATLVTTGKILLGMKLGL